MQRQLACREPVPHAAELDVDDLPELRTVEPREEDHVVDAVQELGTEVRAQLTEHALAHPIPHRCIGIRRHFGDELRADVARHDHHAVAEVHRPSLPVGEPAVLEQLQQHVEDIGVRLLDLVEQQHAVRPAPDRLGELAAFLVADVARRRTDQSRDRVLLHVLAHVEADHRALVVEEQLGKRTRQLRLPDTGGAEEDERADGPVGIGEPCASSTHGVGDRADRVLLSDDATVQILFDAEQLLHLALEHLVERDTRPSRDDGGDILFADLFFEERAIALHLDKARLFLLERALQFVELAIAKLGGATEVTHLLGTIRLVAHLLHPFLDVANGRQRALLLLPARAESATALLQVGELALEPVEAFLRRLVGFLAQRLTLDLELANLAFDDVQLGRERVDLDAQLRRGFVDQVDRLVRQEPIGDVAIAQHCCGDDRGVGDAHTVVHLVALLEAAEDADGVLDRRLVDDDWLKAPLERGVLLDVLAIFVERGGADAAQLAARERGLEHVAGVHRTLSGAGADERVQLVDEEDHRAVRRGDLAKHGLEPVLELAAILAAGDHRTEVERDHALVLQALGHVARRDPLRKTLGDRGLADAGLADEHRVVLGTAREHLDDTPDLVVATDDGVELAAPRGVGQIAPVLLECLVLRLGVRVGDALRSAHRLERGVHAVGRDPCLLEQAAGLAFRLCGEREEEMLGRDVLVLETAHLVECGHETRCAARC